jgi:hypothetical protein
VRESPIWKIEPISESDQGSRTLVKRRLNSRNMAFKGEVKRSKRKG